MSNQHPRKPRPLRPGAHEWVGGRFKLPFYVQSDGSDGPVRPDVDLWLELPDDLVVGTQMIDPENGIDPPSAFLADVMDAPLIGEPRRPARIRTADAGLADELRRRFPDIGVVAAPTPEAEAALASMLDHFAESEEDGEPSYLQEGNVTAAHVAALFEAAARLYRAVPWERAAEELDLIRLDLPSDDVYGLCGMLCTAEQGRGILLFPSLPDWERFADAFESHEEADGEFEPGTPFLGLLYERGADLPKALRREVSQHRWPVADAQAYPVVQYNDADNAARPATEAEMEIVAACAWALASFFDGHATALPAPDDAPISERYRLEDGLEVRVTIPFMAQDPDAEQDPDETDSGPDPVR